MDVGPRNLAKLNKYLRGWIEDFFKTIIDPLICKMLDQKRLFDDLKLIKWYTIGQICLDEEEFKFK